MKLQNYQKKNGDQPIHQLPLSGHQNPNKSPTKLENAPLYFLNKGKNPVSLFLYLKAVSTLTF